MIYSEECKLENLTYKDVPITFAGIEFCGKEVNRNPVYFTRINKDMYADDGIDWYVMFATAGS